MSELFDIKPHPTWLLLFEVLCGWLCVRRYRQVVAIYFEFLPTIIVFFYFLTYVHIKNVYNDRKKSMLSFQQIYPFYATTNPKLSIFLYVYCRWVIPRLVCYKTDYVKHFKNQFPLRQRISHFFKSGSIYLFLNRGVDHNNGNIMWKVCKGV